VTIIENFHGYIFLHTLFICSYRLKSIELIMVRWHMPEYRIFVCRKCSHCECYADRRSAIYLSGITHPVPDSTPSASTSSTSIYYITTIRLRSRCCIHKKKMLMLNKWKMIYVIDFMNSSCITPVLTSLAWFLFLGSFTSHTLFSVPLLYCLSEAHCFFALAFSIRMNY
jgi:hypothetical protein